MKDILLYDRVKETSHITGTSDVILEGAAAGFSAFLDYIPLSGDSFYAITDGSKYEVGSGTLYQDGFLILKLVEIQFAHLSQITQRLAL